MFLLYLVPFILSSITNSQIFPGNSVIDNTNWLDTNGNFIHAHGGQIFEYNNLFYWIGTTQKQYDNGKWLSAGVNCYSSNDLMNWKFENRIFTNTSIKTSVPPPFRLERPKILYNNATNKFVMWFKLDSASFAGALIGLCISDVVCGDNSYTFIDSFQPDGLPADDLGLFKDNNGITAYFVRNTNHTFAGISMLNKQYTNTTSQGVISRGPHIEAPALFKLDTYYLIGSHLTGWKPNAQELCVTNNNITLSNAIWNDNKNSCPNPTSSSTTYNSQTTFVLRLNNYVNNKYVFLYMGDIWNNPNISKATYLWLPFVFGTNNPQSFPKMPHLKQWIVNNYTVSIPSHSNNLTYI